MKSKRKKQKRKFVDLTSSTAPFYQNNRTSKSIIIQNQQDKYFDNNSDQNNKIEEYQPPLEVLYSEYPNFPEEMIEDLYIEKQRNYFQTREALDILSCPQEEDQVRQMENNSESQSQSQAKLVPEYEDINKYIQFTFDDDFSNNNFDINAFNDEYTIPNYNQSQINKCNDEYKSVFSISSNPLIQQTPGGGGEGNMIIDELMLDEYITFIKNAFPKYSRVDITKMICECDFDIDKTMLQLFECNSSSKELETLEESTISNREEILNNFTYNYNNDNWNSNNSDKDKVIDINSLAKHNVQKRIENEIIKSNLKDHFAIGKEYEKDFPVISESENGVNNKNEEYFLDKKIDQIKNQIIRNDLSCLCSKFPFEDEFTIKWIYYQYMDYSSALHYLNINSKTPMKGGLKGLIEKMDHERQLNKNKSVNNKAFNQSQSQNGLNNQSHINKMLTSIINHNPEKWEVNNTLDNISLNDYQSIRKQLMLQAQMAFQSNRFNEGKEIMAKAQRYKYEINKVLGEKKLDLFLKNNRQLAIENMYRIKEHCIDLHGLSVEESKIVLRKKMKDLKDVKERECLTNITLCIITGKGLHSKNGIPVLLPELSSWLKNQLKIRTKVEPTRGMIRIML